MDLQILDFSGFSGGRPFGQNLHLSVDLGYLFKAGVIGREEISLVVNRLVDSFRSAVGPHGNVAVAVFNFEFGRTGAFDVRESPSQVGRFSEELRKRHPGVRTPIPFYSFLHFGPHSRALDPYTLVRSSGPGSPFSFQIDHDYSVVAVGHHINKALSIVHHVESLVKAPWRSDKWFSGTVVNRDGVHEKRSVQFPVRGPGVRFSSLTLNGDLELRRRGVIETGNLEFGRKVLTVEAARLFPLMDELVGSFSAKNRPWVQPILEGETGSGVLTPRESDALFWRREKS